MEKLTWTVSRGNSVKGLAMTAGVGAIGTFLGISEPFFAQAAGIEPLPNWASMGVAGASLTLVLVVVSKVIPRAVERMSEAVEKAAKITADSQGELKESVEGMRQDHARYQESHLAFLRDAMRRDIRRENTDRESNDHS